jgi:hypothetical protein
MPYLKPVINQDPKIGVLEKNIEVLGLVLGNTFSPVVDELLVLRHFVNFTFCQILLQILFK